MARGRRWKGKRMGKVSGGDTAADLGGQVRVQQVEGAGAWRAGVAAPASAWRRERGLAVLGAADRPFSWRAIWEHDKNTRSKTSRGNLICWASDLELGPKVMGALAKGVVVVVRPDVYSLEKHQAMPVCSREMVPIPWASPSVPVRWHGQAPNEDGTHTEGRNTRRRKALGGRRIPSWSSGRHPSLQACYFISPACWSGSSP